MLFHHLRGEDGHIPALAPHDNSSPVQAAAVGTLQDYLAISLIGACPASAASEQANRCWSRAIERCARGRSAASETVKQSSLVRTKGNTGKVKINRSANEQNARESNNKWPRTYYGSLQWSLGKGNLVHQLSILVDKTSQEVAIFKPYRNSLCSSLDQPRLPQMELC